MVLVLALRPDVQVAFSSAADGLEEMAEHLGRYISGFLTPELRVPFEIDPASEIHQDSGVAVVHREDETVAGYAEFLSKSSVYGFSKDDSDILNRVVFIDLQIALGID